MPPDPPSGARLRRSKLVSSCSEVWLRPWKLSFVAAVKSSPVGRAYRNWMDSHRKYHREGLYFVFLFFFCFLVLCSVIFKSVLESIFSIISATGLIQKKSQTRQCSSHENYYTVLRAVVESRKFDVYIGGEAGKINK